MKVLDYDGLSYLCTKYNDKLSYYLPLSGGSMNKNVYISMPNTSGDGGVRVGMYSSMPVCLLNSTNIVIQMYCDTSDNISCFSLNYNSLLGCMLNITSSQAKLILGKYNTSTSNLLGSAFYVPKSGNGYFRMVNAGGTEYTQINPSGIYCNKNSSSTKVFATNGSIVDLPTSYSVATTTSTGLLSYTDKIKLDNLTYELVTTTTDGMMSYTDKIKLDNIDIDSLIVETTYSELKELRDNSQLKPGQQYRITDYQCTTTQSDTQSAGNQFDIIVVADDVNKLNECARACLHDGDTYFADCKLEAWQIWYSLDNDTTRFVWADSDNGKGVIYRMIDEFNNDVPYDFKNIQFKRYKITSTTNEGYANLVKYYFGIDDSIDGLVIDTTDFNYYYTFGFNSTKDCSIDNKYI